MTDKKTFHDTGVDATLADALAAKGITHPFPIQELTLPMALKGADIIGQARTGTGKTLGFGLPLLQRIDPSSKRTQALVVVPTRELCIQVASDLEIGSARDITSIAVYGGVPIDPQTEALTNGVHVVVGTPGRLLDHLNRGNLDLSQVTELVLDEADEMLDMGFLPDVERLIEATPADGRHTMLFSATMPSTIVGLARRYMSHPTFMRAEMEESDVAPTVEQHFFLVHRMDKPRVLARILQSPERGGVYVFTRTKNMADRLVKELDELGVSAIAIHGDLRQTTREKNLDRFRDGRADVLVATEVAARGLDVENVTHVVNYDCPDDEKMYLHRIGRTARAGNKGVAITFAQFNEVDRLNVIRKAVEATDRAVEEVFSTSDRLAELFDLPEETPWAHLSKRGKSAASGSGSAKDSGSGKRSGSGRTSSVAEDRSGGRGSSRSGRGRSADETTSGSRESREGTTDGRSKNSRSSEGRGERSSSRRRSGATPSDDAAGKAAAEAAPAAAERQDAEPPSERSRSRKRTEEASPATGTRSRSRTRTGTAVTSEGRTREEDGTGATGTREPAQRDGGGRGGDDRRSSGRTRARATKGGGGKSGRSGRSDEERTPARSEVSESPRGRGSSRSRGSSKGQGGRAADREPKSRSNGDTADRPGETPTRRGEDARGEGTPQLARRVKVEHLP